MSETRWCVPLALRRVASIAAFLLLVAAALLLSRPPAEASEASRLPDLADVRGETAQGAGFSTTTTTAAAAAVSPLQAALRKRARLHRDTSASNKYPHILTLHMGRGAVAAAWAHPRSCSASSLAGFGIPARIGHLRSPARARLLAASARNNGSTSGMDADAVQWQARVETCLSGETDFLDSCEMLRGVPDRTSSSSSSTSSLPPSDPSRLPRVTPGDLQTSFPVPFDGPPTGVWRTVTPCRWPRATKLFGKHLRRSSKAVVRRVPSALCSPTNPVACTCWAYDAHARRTHRQPAPSDASRRIPSLRGAFKSRGWVKTLIRGDGSRLVVVFGHSHARGLFAVLTAICADAYGNAVEAVNPAPASPDDGVVFLPSWRKLLRANDTNSSNSGAEVEYRPAVVYISSPEPTAEALDEVDARVVAAAQLLAKRVVRATTVTIAVTVAPVDKRVVPALIVVARGMWDAENADDGPEAMHQSHVRFLIDARMRYPDAVVVTYPSHFVHTARGGCFSPHRQVVFRDAAICAVADANQWQRTAGQDEEDEVSAVPPHRVFVVADAFDMTATRVCRKPPPPAASAATAPQPMSPPNFHVAVGTNDVDDDSEPPQAQYNLTTAADDDPWPLMSIGDGHHADAPVLYNIAFRVLLLFRDRIREFRQTASPPPLALTNGSSLCANHDGTTAASTVAATFEPFHAPAPPPPLFAGTTCRRCYEGPPDNDNLFVWPWCDELRRRRLAFFAAAEAAAARSLANASRRVRALAHDASYCARVRVEVAASVVTDTNASAPSDDWRVGAVERGLAVLLASANTPVSRVLVPQYPTASEFAHVAPPTWPQRNTDDADDGPVVCGTHGPRGFAPCAEAARREAAAAAAASLAPPFGDFLTHPSDHVDRGGQPAPPGQWNIDLACPWSAGRSLLLQARGWPVMPVAAINYTSASEGDHGNVWAAAEPRPCLVHPDTPRHLYHGTQWARESARARRWVFVGNSILRFNLAALGAALNDVADSTEEWYETRNVTADRKSRLVVVRRQSADNSTEVVASYFGTPSPTTAVLDSLAASAAADDGGVSATNAITDVVLTTGLWELTEFNTRPSRIRRSVASALRHALRLFPRANVTLQLPTLMLVHDPCPNLPRQKRFRRHILAGVHTALLEESQRTSSSTSRLHVADPFDLSALRQKTESRWPSFEGGDGDDDSGGGDHRNRHFIPRGDGIHSQGPVLLSLTLAFFAWNVSVVPILAATAPTTTRRDRAAVPIWRYEHQSIAARGMKERLGQMLSRLDATGDSTERREARELQRTGVLCARCFMQPTAPVFANAWCSMHRAQAIADCGSITQISAWAPPRLNSTAADVALERGFDPSFGVSNPETLRFNDSLRLRAMLPMLPPPTRSSRAKDGVVDESRAERGPYGIASTDGSGGASRMLSTAARLGLLGFICGNGG